MSGSKPDCAIWPERLEGLLCPIHGTDCAHGRDGGFKCRRCKKVKCGATDGGDEDPVAFGLCDRCWVLRELDEAKEEVEVWKGEALSIRNALADVLGDRGGLDRAAIALRVAVEGALWPTVISGGVLRARDLVCDSALRYAASAELGEQKLAAAKARGKRLRALGAGAKTREQTKRRPRGSK